MLKITNQLRLLQAINLKYVSHLIALSGWFQINLLFVLFYLPWKFFSMIKTRGTVRTQSTMLTKYLRYRGGSRTTSTSKIDCFVIIIFGCCSSPRSASTPLDPSSSVSLQFSYKQYVYRYNIYCQVKPSHEM